MDVTFSVPSELAQFASLYLCETWGCPDDSNGIQHEYVDLQRLCQQHFGWEFLGWTLMNFLFLFKQGFQEVQFFLVPEPACATKKLFFEYFWFIACIHDIQIRQLLCAIELWSMRKSCLERWPSLQVFNVEIGGWHIWCFCQRQSKKMLGGLVCLAYC